GDHRGYERCVRGGREPFLAGPVEAILAAHPRARPVPGRHSGNGQRPAVPAILGRIVDFVACRGRSIRGPDLLEHADPRENFGAPGGGVEGHRMTTPVIIRVLHIAATCTSLGGLFYARTVLWPTAQSMPPNERDLFLAKAIRRFQPI